MTILLLQLPSSQSIASWSQACLCKTLQKRNQRASPRRLIPPPPREVFCCSPKQLVRTLVDCIQCLSPKLILSWFGETVFLLIRNSSVLRQSPDKCTQILSPLTGRHLPPPSPSPHDSLSRVRNSRVSEPVQGWAGP